MDLFKTAPSPRTDRSEQPEHPALSRVRTVSTLLDDFIRIPGTNVRFGLDPILGILPVAGDSVSSLISLYIIAEGYRADAPPSLLAKMSGLLAVDFFIGSVPLVGPVFDAFWKNNKWSVALLEEHLERTGSGS
ncbi:MAG: DUF4112 domain-containing protein [Halobacteriota archaeon]